MRYYWIVFIAILLMAPFCVSATGLQEIPGSTNAQPMSAVPEQNSQNVEEPDAADDDDSAKEMPATEIPGQTEEAVKPKVEAVKPVPAAPASPEGDANYDRVILQGLNKVTARAQTIEAPIGSVVRFGTIEIIAHNCWKSAPDERPENAALLEISEIKQGEAPEQIFLGWMFSSSPGLSALEHPFYDVTVVKCQKAEPAPVPAPAKPAAVPSKPAAKKK